MSDLATIILLINVIVLWSAVGRLRARVAWLEREANGLRSDMNRIVFEGIKARMGGGE